VHDDGTTPAAGPWVTRALLGYPRSGKPLRGGRRDQGTKMNTRNVHSSPPGCHPRRRTQTASASQLQRWSWPPTQRDCCGMWRRAKAGHALFTSSRNVYITWHTRHVRVSRAARLSEARWGHCTDDPLMSPHSFKTCEALSYPPATLQGTVKAPVKFDVPLRITWFGLSRRVGVGMKEAHQVGANQKAHGWSRADHARQRIR
jgi:hypothetical protein